MAERPPSEPVPDRAGGTSSSHQSAAQTRKADEKNTKVDVEGEGDHEITSKGEAKEQFAASTPATRDPTKWIKGALIGAGSFGAVFLGTDASNGLLMAVKQLKLPSSSATSEDFKMDALRAFEHEIHLLKTLQHENIVQYFDSSYEGGHLNMFMEYVPGGSVASLLKDYGAFEESLVRNWVRQTLQGLTYLHSQGFIHGNIRGSKLLVDNHGMIKLGSVGKSMRVDEFDDSGTGVRDSSAPGSVFWMAPEVIKRTAYTLKTDVWSIGCLAIEMFTGDHPWPQLNEMQAKFEIGTPAKPMLPSAISGEAEDFLDNTFRFEYINRPSAVELMQHQWMVTGLANSAPQMEDEVT